MSEGNLREDFMSLTDLSIKSQHVSQNLKKNLIKLKSDFSTKIGSKKLNNKDFFNTNTIEYKIKGFQKKIFSRTETPKDNKTIHEKLRNIRKENDQKRKMRISNKYGIKKEGIITPTMFKSTNKMISSMPHMGLSEKFQVQKKKDFERNKSKLSKRKKQNFIKKKKNF